jgi:hypothetical protein
MGDEQAVADIKAARRALADKPFTGEILMHPDDYAKAFTEKERQAMEADGRAQWVRMEGDDGS